MGQSWFIPGIVQRGVGPQQVILLCTALLSAARVYNVSCLQLIHVWIVGIKAGPTDKMLICEVPDMMQLLSTVAVFVNVNAHGTLDTTQSVRCKPYSIGT